MTKNYIKNYISAGRLLIIVSFLLFKTLELKNLEDVLVCMEKIRKLKDFKYDAVQIFFSQLNIKRMND